MKSLQKDTDKGDLEWSEVFKGALLKVEPLPRVGVRGVLRGHTLSKLNSSFHSWSILLPGEVSVGTQSWASRLPAGRGRPRR